jgi:hypothetical protein
MSETHDHYLPSGEDRLTKVLFVERSHDETRRSLLQQFRHIGCESSPCSQMPPLDLITICSTYAEDDESGSVSSMSSNGDLAERPRSIFKAYWDASHVDRTTQSSRDVTGMLISTRQQDSSSSLTRSYQRTSKATECESPSLYKRQIFAKSCCSRSAASLPRVAEISYARSWRKTQSASCLQPKKSCLRQSRFSGSQRHHHHQVPPVSFSNHVDVVIIEHPYEQWAPDGWSKWFT